MTRIRKVLAIEDDSDCATCTARNTSEWELLQTVKVVALGSVYCQECGRSYLAIAAEEDACGSFEAT